MALQFQCNHCGRDIIVKHLKIGENAICRDCGAANIIPQNAIETDQEADYMRHAERSKTATESQHMQKKKNSFFDIFTTPLEQLLVPPVETSAMKRSPTALKIVKPSVLGPKGIFEIIKNVFLIYKIHFLRLLLVVGIIDLVWLIPLIITQLASKPGEQEMPTLLIALTMIAFFVVSIIGYPLMQNALVYAIAVQFTKPTFNVKKAFAFAFQQLGAPIGAMMLAGGVVFGLLITRVLFPVAIYIWIIWLFVFPVTLFEGLRSTKALGRSFQLVKNNWWRCFGTMALLVLTMLIIIVVLDYVPYVGFFIGYIFVPPIYTIGHLLLYFDIRVRKEGYTPDDLARELGQLELHYDNKKQE